MAGRFYDFDAAEREHQGDPITFRAFGEEVELPAERPARLVLLVERVRQLVAEGNQDATMDDDELRRTVDAVFGVDTVERWMDRGASLPALGRAMHAAILLYAGHDPDEVAQGEAPAPDQGAAPPSASPTSSSTGRRSRRTSPASTRSTSTPKSRKG